MYRMLTTDNNWFGTVAQERALRKIRKAAHLVQQNGLIQIFRLVYVYALAPVLSPLTPFIARVCWQVRRHLSNLRIERELGVLKGCKDEILRQGSNGYRLPITGLRWSSQLKPDLIEALYSQRLVLLGSYDQDGYLYCPLGSIDGIPQVSEDKFLPRKRFLLDLVVLDGYLAIRKNYRGNKIHFVREIKALGGLARAGCNVPAILDIDFDNLTLFVSFIPGKVLRHELAKRGAKIRDRDVKEWPHRKKHDAYLQRLRRIKEGRDRLNEVIDSTFISEFFQQIRLSHRTGVRGLDIKYGNVIIEEFSSKPFFIDFENVAMFDNQGDVMCRHYRDRDIEAFNLHFGTRYLHWKEVRRRIKAKHYPIAQKWYAPVYIRDGLRIGRLWDVESGFGRWHFILKQNFPPLQNCRVLDLGANNAFNSLQMLREGARESVAIEMAAECVQQGVFLKEAFEWADNRDYNLKYYQCDMRELPKLALGKFDFAFALCSIYYLQKEDIANLIRYISEITTTFILQCNIQEHIDRRDPETYEKAGVEFAVNALEANGFPHTEVIAPKGYARPLVIGRQ